MAFEGIDKDGVSFVLGLDNKRHGRFGEAHLGEDLSPLVDLVIFIADAAAKAWGFIEAELVDYKSLSCSNWPCLNFVDLLLSFLSASGDSGMPEVVADPQGEVARTFQNLGVCVVQQCAKIRQQVSTAVFYDKLIRAIRVRVPGSDDEFFLHPATVRRNDRSAQSVDEWTGEQKLQYGDVPEDIEPEDIRPMGNYAVSITWPDGFSQIAPYDQLQTLERLIEAPLLSS